MGPAVYLLGSATTLVCAVLLLRGYFRSGTRLLVWSAVCFFGLAISNLLIFIDLRLFPEVDLYFWRLFTAALAMMALLYGLIWEGD